MVEGDERGAGAGHRGEADQRQADLSAPVHGRALRRKSLCRTFSDCTSGPRLGLVSGCFPLDPFYASHPDAKRLREGKASSA